MCGRFTLTLDSEQIQKAFPWVGIPDNIKPRYNIAPSQPVAVIPNNGTNHLDYYNWGLIPSWAKDPTIGNRLINARAETLAQKPSFRSAYLRRRCLILADGFFEWQSQPGRKIKIPMFIRLQSRKPFTFAGLWEIWHSSDGSKVQTCAIITTQPNELLQPIHNRMPVILPEGTFQQWLNPGETPPNVLDHLLRPYPADELEAVPVSPKVNSPQYDGPECIQIYQPSP
jgi:putative SOS response-associated peptidase YedK